MKEEEELGKKFRESLENYEVPYEPNDWLDMKAKLLTKNSFLGNTRHFLTKNWYWFAASLLLLFTGAYFVSNNTDNQVVTNKNNSQKTETKSLAETQKNNSTEKIESEQKNGLKSEKIENFAENNQKNKEFQQKKDHRIKSALQEKTEQNKNRLKPVLQEKTEQNENRLKPVLQEKNKEILPEKDQISDVSLLKFSDLKVKDSVFQKEIDPKQRILSTQMGFDKKIQFAVGAHLAAGLSRRDSWNLGMGLKLNYIFNPKFAFQTGFWFTHFESEKNYLSKIALPKDNNNLPQINADSIYVFASNKEHSETTLLEIPFGFQYYISSRFSISSSISTYYVLEDGKRERLPSFMINSSEQKTKKQEFSLGMLYFSANYEFPLTKKLNLGLNSFVKIPLNNQINLPNSWFGLQTVLIFGK
ncbi:MAG: hypothetical protein EAZ97_03095 [Bacteroidetes bacterium]|nr:MAG: hypothetical protein EAZ97_03095 [Bacteroidota bacterium]